MDHFSISDLQRFSGIKSHTIRIWEQRYKALKPSRSEGNTRYYSGSQLKRLLNITSLMDQGYKISEICTMKDEAICTLINEKISQSNVDFEKENHFVSQLIIAAISFDESYFDKLFSGCLLRFGMKETYSNVIYPLMIRLGMMWSSDTLSSAQEHFITNILRQKILTAIDSLPPPANSKDPWILFLPENEFHEISLLFAQFILRLNGRKVIYLGASVPLAALINTAETIHAGHLYMFFVQSRFPDEANEYLKKLSRQFPKIQIHISGNSQLLDLLHTGKNIKRINNIEELEKESFFV